MTIRFYTGPCAVHQIAEKFREAGLTVEIEGTEHVFVRASSAWALSRLPIEEIHAQAEAEALRVLREKHGTVFGLK